MTIFVIRQLRMTLAGQHSQFLQCLPENKPTGALYVSVHCLHQKIYFFKSEKLGYLLSHNSAVQRSWVFALCGIYIWYVWYLCYLQFISGMCAFYLNLHFTQG